MPHIVAESMAEALTLAEDGYRVVAGCTDFFPSLRPGQMPAGILDIGTIPGMTGIARTDDGWRIGAATTWTQIAAYPFPSAFDGLRQAARQVGSVQIQNRGTVAGNICNASPAADGVPPLLSLGARVEIASKAGTRQVALADFITGVRRIALAPGELVTAVVMPAPSEGARGSFVKLGSRTHLVISIAMVAAVIDTEGDRIAAARIAVGSCSPVAQRLPALEHRLAGIACTRIDAAAFGHAGDYAPLSPISDVRGSDEYRRDVVPELCRRAVLRACGGE